ncbi:hypothetical protein FACS189444_0840 [Spirochaetia bacterium]|nr:hypothetical protein FACS189444_0840 [Spirochaetia bacterium]
MKKNLVFKKFVGYAAICLIGGVVGFALVSCNSSAKSAETKSTSISNTAGISENSGAASKVYFTTDISPAGLMAAYNALGQKPDNTTIASGKVAVKMSTGEPPNA